MYRSRLTQVKNDKEFENNDVKRLSARKYKTTGTRIGQQPAVEVPHLPRNNKNAKKKPKVSNEFGMPSAVSSGAGGGAPATTARTTMHHSARMSAAQLYTKKFHGRGGLPIISNLRSPLPMLRKDTISPYEQPIGPKQTLNSNAAVSFNADNNEFQMPIKENKSYAYLCKSVKKNKKHLSINTPAENSTTDEVELVPLMHNAESTTSNNPPELSSARLYMNVRELMERKQYDLMPDELDRIKNVVKTDTRHRQLKQDDELFCDILRTQLEEICKQQALVKQTLMAFDSNYKIETDHATTAEVITITEPYEDCEPPFEFDTQSLTDAFRYGDNNSDMFELHLDGLHDKQDVVSVASMTLQRTATARKHLETVLNSASNSGTQLNDVAEQKQQLEYVFRNLPTLQHEISKLRSISEKLASSLKTSSSLYCCSTSRDDMANELSTRFLQTQRPLSRIQINLYAMLVPQRQAQSFARVKYLSFSQGIVKEFRIEQKSFNELKNTSVTEDSDWIYIPVSGEATELKRTSFKHLKENPEMLMQYLKQRSAQHNFKLTEPDQLLRQSIRNQVHTPEAGGDACSMRDNVKEKITYNKMQCNSLNSANNKYGDAQELNSYRSISTQVISSPPMLEASTTTTATALQQIFLKHLLNKAADYVVSDTAEKMLAPTVSAMINVTATPKQSPNSVIEISIPQKEVPNIANPNKSATATELKEAISATTQTSTKKSSSQVLKTKPSKPKCQQKRTKASGTEVAVPTSKPAAPLAKVVSKQKKLKPQLKTKDLSVAKHFITTKPQKQLPSGEKVILFRAFSKRRTFTPIRAVKSEVKPERNLFRTVTVGAVQMIVLLVFIMAFTYPDVRCLM